jgi:hypothetical protein
MFGAAAGPNANTILFGGRSGAWAITRSRVAWAECEYEPFIRRSSSVEDEERPLVTKLGAHEDQ